MPATRKKATLRPDLVRANGVARADDAVPMPLAAPIRDVVAKTFEAAPKPPAGVRTGMPPAKLSSVPIVGADGRAPAAEPRGAAPETVFHRKGTATATTFRPAYLYYDAEVEAPKSRRREPRAKLLRKSI